MLTSGEIIKIFSKSKRKEYIPECEEISNIMQYVKIDSGLLENEMDYYFRISIFELSKSKIPDDTIFEMAKNGWVLSKDKKYIEFFY